MKLFIQNLLRESLLNEKLIEVNEDVDYIYNEYFKNDIDEIQRTGIITKEMFSIYTTHTKNLISKNSVKANNLNPCIIYINKDKGNNYIPKKRMINLTINYNARNYALNYDGNIENAKNDLDEEKKDMFEQEFTEQKIKGTINHELAHWIDDTFHNNHIEKTIKSAQEMSDKKYNKKFIENSINTHSLEIQGQIHNIKQAKRKYGDEWDELTFKDLRNIIPALKTIYTQLSNPYKFDDDKSLKGWVRNLKTRMYREGLLGKNMVNN